MGVPVSWMKHQTLSLCYCSRKKETFYSSYSGRKRRKQMVFVALSMYVSVWRPEIALPCHVYVYVCVCACVCACRKAALWWSIQLELVGNGEPLTVFRYETFSLSLHMFCRFITWRYNIECNLTWSKLYFSVDL